MTAESVLKRLINRYPILDTCEDAIRAAAYLLVDMYQKNGKLLVCGNGGSCADSDHIVGEMMKSFAKKRPLNEALVQQLSKTSNDRGAVLASKLEMGLEAISLNAHTALITAISNDIGGDFIFAQQIISYGRRNDVLLAISTSGNSQNVLDACITAKAKGMKVIALTGETGGKMKTFADVTISVPLTYTPDVQELHLPIYHALCLYLEATFF